MCYTYLLTYVLSFLNLISHSADSAWQCTETQWVGISYLVF